MLLMLLLCHVACFLIRPRPGSEYTGMSADAAEAAANAAAAAATVVLAPLLPGALPACFVLLCLLLDVLLLARFCVASQCGRKCRYSTHAPGALSS